MGQDPRPWEEDGLTPMERQERYQADKDRARRARDYRSFVGPPDRYDVVAANQFTLLHLLGLREHHFVLDLGCGSLRAGRLLIPYLLPGRYFGVEPEQWLIQAGVDADLGRDILRIKRPVFRIESEFTLERLEQQFDFILAHSIFSHASPAQVERCLAEARKVMRPDGLVAATFVPGTTDYAGNRWAYCATYTWGRIRRFATEHGLVCTPLGWPHPTGQTWCALLHAGNQAGLRTCERLAAWMALGEPPRGEPGGVDATTQPRRRGLRQVAWRAAKSLGRWVRSSAGETSRP